MEKGDVRKKFNGMNDTCIISNYEDGKRGANTMTKVALERILSEIRRPIVIGTDGGT